ncbi:MAG TPA: hypothetical protein VES89_05770, partial [Candidatus Competibacteraceae bacterium]|nr:hypothetical protein [Candidatus Competibacteraceae bacterium]
PDPARRSVDDSICFRVGPAGLPSCLFYFLRWWQGVVALTTDRPYSKLSMTSIDFAAQVCHLLGQAAPSTILKAPMSMLVNKASCGQPSSAIIEWCGARVRAPGA